MTTPATPAQRMVEAIEHLQRLTADADRFSEEQFGMSGSQLATFESVILGAAKVNDVARATRQHVSSASRAVDHLVQDDLVTREEDPDDRRAVRLGLTDKGRQLADEMTTLRVRLMGEMMADFSPHEASLFADLALRFASRAQQLYTAALED